MNPPDDRPEAPFRIDTESVSVDPASAYFRIDDEYAAELGGWRWSRDGEAVELAMGRTFAFAAEIALFLEGLTARRPPLHFAHVLHLMAHFGIGSGLFHRVQSDLAVRFHDEGRPLRNAGALAAEIARDVPDVPGAPSGRVLTVRLARSGPKIRGGGRLPAPALTPDLFAEAITSRLARLDAHEIHHWLAHGCAPIEDGAEALARRALIPPRRRLERALALLARRERVAPALAWLPMFAAALHVPPRRLDLEPLATGGYSDVSSRGDLGQVLPWMRALDPDEFLRRLADGELLFYRREKPVRRESVEWWVVVDQGVRAWGTVRLLLTAAALVLGRQAARMSRTIRFVATSDPTATYAPDLPGRDDPSALADLLDASDLTNSPAIALRSAFDRLAQSGRSGDLVLLTHPRNLDDPAVAEVLARSEPNVRAFALTADRRGSVRWSVRDREGLRTLASWQVPLASSAPPRRTRPNDWSGPVLPLRDETIDPRSWNLFDFEASGRWFVAGSTSGRIMTLDLESDRSIPLPPPLVEGAEFRRWDAVLGTTGGAVACGRDPAGRAVIVAYDWGKRTCRVHVHPQVLRWPTGRRPTWTYDPRYHAVLFEAQDVLVALDLDSGATHGRPAIGGDPWGGRNRAAARPRVEWACLLAHRPLRPPGTLEVRVGIPIEPGDPALALDETSGGLHLWSEAHGSLHLTPSFERRPLLVGTRAWRAQIRGDVLALCTVRSGMLMESPVLRLFHLPEGRLMWIVGSAERSLSFALSPQGRRLAFVDRNGLLKMFEVDRGLVTLLDPWRPIET